MKQDRRKKFKIQKFWSQYTSSYQLEVTMDQNTEFLNYIYQNSQMGIETINKLVDIVEDPDLSQELSNQLSEYQQINNEAVSRLHDEGQNVEGIGKMTEFAASMSIGMKTIANRSSKHISEMMIQGSTKGITEVVANLKKYTDADDRTISLGKQLLKTEQNNIDSLKHYL